MTHKEKVATRSEQPNYSDFIWLTMAQTLRERACVFCGYTWLCAADLDARHPIAANVGAEKLACEVCWDDGNRLTPIPEIQADTLNNIVREVADAREKFPSNRHMLAALMEEVGELAQALLDDQGSKRVYAEAKQVACVAIRIMEEGDTDFFITDDN